MTVMILGLHAIDDTCIQTSTNTVHRRMNRSDLVTDLAARFGQLTQRDVETAVDAIIDAMTATLVRGHRIEIRGFGSFSVKRQAPRKGRNPRSGESVSIPERRVTHFKPGKALREGANVGRLGAREVFRQ